MSTGILESVPVEKAAEIVQHIELSDEAKPLLEDDLATGPFLNLLIEKGHLSDAVNFLAHALPKREAVWWGSQCVRGVIGEEPPPAIAEALKTAEDWAAEPSEDNRRAAQRAFEAATLKNPAGIVALAAFVSEGSISLANLPPVLAPENATARAISGALLLSGLLSQPEKAPEKYNRFLKLGITIADGDKSWKKRA